MPRLLITKEFSFEAAHALKDYDGPCRNIHGHSYHLSVTVTGVPLNNPGSPKQGMIMDFSELKEIIKHHVINLFDHALIVPSTLDIAQLRNFGEGFSKIVEVDYQPTTENLLTDLASRIAAGLPAQVKLHSIKLRETATSYAEWFAE